MAETYYDVLEVSPDATQEEITAAYRERVLETHPDRNDDPDAAERFKRVTTAEEVLSDDVERARYDRLGHDAYVARSDGAGDETAESGRPSDARETAASADSSDPFADLFDGTDRSWTTGETDRSGPSHHARHRRRRQRATERARSTAEWWIGDAAETTRANAGVGTESTDGRRDAGSEASGYAVHDWNDDVDLGRSRPAMDQSTVVVVACLALLYPVFVYASVAPAFPLVVNGVVAACTLVLVGYLLTIPRAAIVAFGLWSVLVPVGLPALTAVDPLSPIGLLVTAAFWLPLGYAVAVWWALRP